MSKELEMVCKAIAVSFKEVEKSVYKFAEAAREYHNAYMCGYKERHPRVVHLAYYAKKARVRKKNQNRIRRMK